MKREVETKFFDYRQNNSGGYNIINNDVAKFVIIEALNAEESNRKMADITRNYSEYCTCCGERWWIYADDEDGTDTPTIYGEDARIQPDTFLSNGETIIYYHDGTKEKLHYK